MDLEAELIHLKDRVRSLEEKVSSQSAAIAAARQIVDVPAPVEPSRPGPTFLPPGAAIQAPPPPVGQVPLPSSYPPPPPPGGFPPPSPAAQPAAAASSPVEFDVEAMLRWAGAGLVTLAGIFLVSTAVSRGWIGPELQLFLAALGGAALLGASTYLSERRRPWSLAIGCAGAIVLIVSALATHGWLDLWGPGPALVLAAVAAGVSGAVAAHIRHEAVAVVAALVAMLGALETAQDIGTIMTLSWVAAFILAASGIGFVKQWPALRLGVGWIGAAILAAYALNEDVEGATRVAGLIGAVVIALTLGAGSALAARAGSDDGRSEQGISWRTIDYRIVALVPGWFWLVVAGSLDLKQDIDVGVVAIIVALVFAAVALLARRFDELVSTSTLLGALTLLAVGFAFAIEGPTLMIALAGQAITSYVVARQLDDAELRIGGYLAMGIASLLAAGSMFEALENDGFESVGAGVSTAVIVAIWVGATIASYVRADEVELPRDPLFVTSWIGVMLWAAAALLGAPQGLGLISAVWAVMACIGLVVGLQRDLEVVRTTAVITLAVTLLKLVTIDMGGVDVFWRVGLFFVVGTGLIVLGLKVPSLLPSAPKPATSELPPEPNPHQPTEF